MKYRKKPVAIEAWQSKNNAGTETAIWPRWIIDAINQGVIFADGKDTKIKTLEGNMLVSDGDWIIKGVKGELYPCKPEIFEATYEEAE